MIASELRIGNLLQDKKARICKVEELHKDEFKAYAIVGSSTSLPNEPIQLTEAWLLKLGFEKLDLSKYDNEFFDRYCEMYKERNEPIPDYVIEMNDRVRNYDNYSHPKLSLMNLYSDKEGSNIYGFENFKKLNSVHQIQNLFFAISGEELTYTL